MAGRTRQRAQGGQQGTAHLCRRQVSLLPGRGHRGSELMPFTEPTGPTFLGHPCSAPGALQLAPTPSTVPL